MFHNSKTQRIKKKKRQTKQQKQKNCNLINLILIQRINYKMKQRDKNKKLKNQCLILCFKHSLNGEVKRFKLF